MRSEESETQQKYLKKALSDFTFDVASGGAIRHLADRGYTVQEISKMLDFPTPFERIQRTVWEHFLTQGILRLEEPGKETEQEKYEYVTDYDAFGRKSFRRVFLGPRVLEPVIWREISTDIEKKDRFSDYLKEKCEENGRDFSYVSCDFGLQSRREPEAFIRRIQQLPLPLQEYILGLPWERRLVYHQLDHRMREIVNNLFAGGEYPGMCYFLKTGEKLRLE